MNKFGHALRAARVEMEKSSGMLSWLTPAKGMMAGAGVGMLEGGGRILHQLHPEYLKGLEGNLAKATAAHEATVAGGHAADSAEFLASKKALDTATQEHAKHLNVRNDLYDTANKKWKGLHEAPGAWAKHFGADLLKPMAGWAGAGGLAGAGNQYMHHRAMVDALHTYAPWAAAGVGGLAAYKMARD